MALQIDKITHALACCCIAQAIGPHAPWWVGPAAAILIGAAKEAYDKLSGKGSPEWGDFAADAIGAIAGGILSIL